MLPLKKMFGQNPIFRRNYISLWLSLTVCMFSYGGILPASYNFLVKLLNKVLSYWINLCGLDADFKSLDK